MICTGETIARSWHRNFTFASSVSFKSQTSNLICAFCVSSAGGTVTAASFVSLELEFLSESSESPLWEPSPSSPLSAFDCNAVASSCCSSDERAEAVAAATTDSNGRVVLNSMRRFRFNSFAEITSVSIEANSSLIESDAAAVAASSKSFGGSCDGLRPPVIMLANVLFTFFAGGGTVTGGSSTVAVWLDSLVLGPFSADFNMDCTAMV